MVPSRKPAQPFQFDVKHQYQEDAQSAATEPAQPLRQVPFSPGHQLWQQMLASSSDGLLSTSPDQELSRFGNVPESPAFPVNLSAHMNNAALVSVEASGSWLSPWSMAHIPVVSLQHRRKGMEFLLCLPPSAMVDAL